MDSWTKLNGYVDGELDAGEAAEIAALAAERPDVAKQIADLHQLKAELASCTETFPGEITAGSKRSIASIRSWLAAAGIAFIALGTTIFMHYQGDSAPQGLVGHLVNEHKVWSSSITGVSSEGDGMAGFIPAFAKDLSTGNRFPDLTSIGLSLLRADGRTIAEKHGWLLGYFGMNGCRVSLFIVEQTDAPDTTPVRLQQAETPVQTWSQGGKGYFLTATRMAEQRLQVVTEALFLRTADPGQTNDQTMTALRDRYKASATCLG